MISSSTQLLHVVLLLSFTVTSTYARYFPQWGVTDKFLVENGDDRDRLGVSIEIMGDTIVVGADGDDDRGSTAGAVYVYRKPEGDRRFDADEPQKLLALDGDQNDIFGSTISLQPNVIAIGAPQQNTIAPDAGAVYMFRYDSAQDRYLQAEKLLPSDGALLQNFGFSVELLDNTTLLVGAPGDGNDTGAFYVFADEGGGAGFVEVESYRPDDPSDGQRFGNSVSAYGKYAVIGSVGDDDNGFLSGSAYIYKTEDMRTYTFDKKLVELDGLPEDEYGYSTAISNNTIAIGSHLDDDNFIGQDAGSVYIYSFNTSSSEWYFDEKITRTTIYNRLTSSAQNEFFGFSLALDGDTLAVGAPGANTRLADNSGIAYVYRKQERTGRWRLEERVGACEPPVGDNMGYSVALDMANERLAVGSLEGGGGNNAEENPGAAFVYKRGGALFSFKFSRYLLCRFFY